MLRFIGTKHRVGNVKTMMMRKRRRRMLVTVVIIIVRCQPWAWTEASLEHGLLRIRQARSYRIGAIYIYIIYIHILYKYI